MYHEFFLVFYPFLLAYFPDLILLVGGHTAWLTIIIVAITSIISIAAFPAHIAGFDRSNIPVIGKMSGDQLQSKFLFKPYLIHKVGGEEYHRFFSSGFIHANWMHLLFNMYVLYEFGSILEYFYNDLYGSRANLLYLGLYFGGLAFSDLPAFFMHRNNAYYGSLGASGAVSAVLFSFIMYAPTAGLRLIFFPFFDIPAFVLGIAYMGFSYYAAKNRRLGDNIGHEAHLAGAVFGLLFTIIIDPTALSNCIQQISMYLGIA